MQKLVEIGLGQEAEQHIQSILGEKKGFAQAIFNSVKNWTFTALAPKGTPPTRLQKFDIGGLCSSSESRAWLIEFCGNELRRKSELVFVVDDLYFEPSDPWYTKPQYVRRHTYDTSVIFSVELVPGRAYVAADALRCSRSWDVACFLFNDHIQLDCPKTLTQNVLYLFTMAYDQESFVIGRPA